MACNLLRHCKLCNLSTRIVNSLTSRNIHSSSNEKADIVISGGGMVGTAMACALGHTDFLQDKKIILLESAPEKKDFKLSERYSNRTCAISPATVGLFQNIGAWDEILQMRCQPVKRMQVWESCSDSVITFNDEELMNDLAYIVENDVILEAIRRQLSSLSDRVEVRYQTSAKSYIIPGSTPGHDNVDQNTWVTIETDKGQKIQTKLLIGADGMNSAVRKAGKFHVFQQDYKQQAVVATLEVSGTSDNSVAWQRFLPTGPIAMLPLSSNYSCLIWTTSPTKAKYLKDLQDDNFVDAVNDAFWHERDKDSTVMSISQKYQELLNYVFSDNQVVRQLPPTVVGVDPGSRASFPLSLNHSSNYVKPRVALIGDAAHRLHPLAGQGVNLGFGDVSCLSQVLNEAVQSGSDVGSLYYLSKYETERQRAVLPVVMTIHGLHHLYNTDFSPVVLLRSLGLQSTNALQFVKNKIIQQASS